MFNSSLDVRRPLSRILVPTTPPLRRTSPSSQERCVVDPSILQRTVAASLPYICRIPNAAAVAASPSDQRLLSNLRVAPHLRSSAKEITYRTRTEKENVTFKNHVIQWFEVLAGLLGPNWKAIGLAFNCTFLLFGSVIQLIGCASNIYYINDHLDKRTWTYIFGACYATTMFIPSFQSYRIWSCTAWYLTIAAFPHGQMNSRGYIMGYYDDSIDKFFTD